MLKTEDFVTYEQALALKKLGFIESCLYYYKYHKLIPNEFMNDSGYYYIPLKHFYRSMNSECPEQDDICDAPTLWEAQDWLMREKGIHIILKSSFKEKQILYTPYIASYDWGRPCEGDFPSEYKKALSDGITECLRILEDKIKEGH